MPATALMLRTLPQAMSKHLLFSFIECEAHVDTVSLASQLSIKAQEEADRIYGYQQSHRGILNTLETVKAANRSLDSVR